jgi:cell division protein FtsW (lipid II flippase)
VALVTAFPIRTRRNIELILLALSVGIAVSAYGYLGLATEGRLPGDMVTYGGLLAVFSLVVHVVLRIKARYADPVILPIATAINGLGLVVIHRLDLAEKRSVMDSFALRQIVWTGLGLITCTAVIWFVHDHRTLAKYRYTAMAAGLVLLLLPLVPFLGRQIYGARIWIGIGPFSFQPGELAKIVLAVFFAGYLVTARDSLSLIGRKVLFLQLPRARDLGPLLVSWVVSLLVLIFERDLGSSLLFFGLFIALLYVATERISWIVIGLLLFSGGAFIAWTLFSHVQLRVTIWLHPFDPANADRAYQLIQGLYGMASGGLLGTGLGQGRPDIVPFAESDFIGAAIGEELGLTGFFAVLLLYALLVERGLRTAIGVRDGFGKLFAAGLAFSMALQIFVVVGGITRVIQLTGLTMPFLASGGSSLLSNWIIVGLLLRVSDAARRPPPDTSALNLPAAPSIPPVSTPVDPPRTVTP